MDGKEQPHEKRHHEERHRAHPFPTADAGRRTYQRTGQQAADWRHRVLYQPLHRSCAARPDQQLGAGGHPDGRGHPGGVQHDRLVRRHGGKYAGYALPAAQPRYYLQFRGSVRRGAFTGRPRVHRQLRQDRSRHADGNHAPEHPCYLYFRRSLGSSRERL